MSLNFDNLKLVFIKNKIYVQLKTYRLPEVKNISIYILFNTTQVLKQTELRIHLYEVDSHPLKQRVIKCAKPLTGIILFQVISKAMVTSDPRMRSDGPRRDLRHYASNF